VSDAGLTTAQATTPSRILVVDDNAATVETMAMLLQASGHMVATAANGAQALETARRFEPEVVLMDIGMPEMDGFTAARLMRQERWCARTKLIAITGWGQHADRKRSAAAGFDAHLVKPVSVEALSVTQ
jgi:two-component system CheB/CheR fusion protein